MFWVANPEKNTQFCLKILILSKAEIMFIKNETNKFHKFLLKFDFCNLYKFTFGGLKKLSTLKSKNEDLNIL